MFYQDPATPEFYTLSLHDALPISRRQSSQGACTSAPSRWPLPSWRACVMACAFVAAWATANSRPSASSHDQRRRSVERVQRDRKSTRLNSSHVEISYAVFCLKKKK